MTDPPIPTIRQLTDPAEVDPAGLLLARALEPSYKDALEDPTVRLAYCSLLYVANTRWSFDRGTVWVASLPDEPIAGVLSIIPKPDPDWTDEDDHRYGYDLLAGWDDQLSGTVPDEEAASAPLEALAGPWLYINVLGVEPAHQGRGIGTALMRHFLTIADREKLPAGLITDTNRNVRFYEHLGFEVLREGQESNPLILWTLYREPNPSSL